MSSSTSTLKFTLLPILLAVNFALTACQNSSSPADTEVKERTDVTTDASNSVVSEDANPMSTATADASMTPEQQMIDNLSKYRWSLVTANDGTNQPLTSLTTIKDQVTLNFNKNQGQATISYSVGCNTMSAAYQLQGSQLSTEDSMSTKMSCGDLNAAENRLNDLMEGDSQLDLVDGDTPMLTQVTSDSITLVWQGRMTAQAKYNSKGETVFWAVDSATKPCVNNSAQACLQVKSVTYDEQGVKTSESAWTEFAGDIDGYQHDGNHNEVLRLQRYKLDGKKDSADVTDEDHAYVLDTIIETTATK
ncbi:DUF4377 domain-containing protein [Psychrobacter frigidicola]|uniref:DUF4377 domain-containing protein n=1 Tax=Psychrobacter frigidicola TaxID=45611 RepID=A0A5C7A369_9GAMM|nr:META domain-containing protein [Psychrobacter frigidicola]TXD97518.1 DUF4377 domain-containing protein [Psychrobacter frigidicola]